MQTYTSIKKLLPLDTRAKVVLAEVLLHLKEVKKDWNIKYAYPSTGSVYLNISNAIGVLDIRISHHDTFRDENDLYFEYPENEDIDYFELAKEILIYISREFNCKLQLPTKSSLFSLFVTKEKVKNAKSRGKQHD